MLFFFPSIHGVSCYLILVWFQTSSLSSHRQQSVRAAGWMQEGVSLSLFLSLSLLCLFLRVLLSPAHLKEVSVSHWSKSVVNRVLRCQVNHPRLSFFKRVFCHVCFTGTHEGPRRSALFSLLALSVSAVCVFKKAPPVIVMWSHSKCHSEVSVFMFFSSGF